MRIKSKCKDFYDYLQYSYGQDLNITWKRDKVDKNSDQSILVFKNREFMELGSLSNMNFSEIRSIPDFHHSRFLDFKYRSRIPNCTLFLDYVSILGMTYPILYFEDRRLKIHSCYNYEIFQKLPDEIFQRSTIKKDLSEDTFNKLIDDWRKRNYNILMNYHKTYSAPIFVCSRGIVNPKLHYESYERRVPDNICDKFYIVNRYIPLSDIRGLVSELGSPEKLYQSIYNFFIEIKNNEDIEPPVELNNQEKIVKAGFDLKKSFRHPIK